MKLVAAINAAAIGQSIVSNAGRTYKPADLAPIKRIGSSAVSYRSVGMTESERKGAWEMSGYPTLYSAS